MKSYNVRFYVNFLLVTAFNKALSLQFRFATFVCIIKISNGNIQREE